MEFFKGLFSIAMIYTAAWLVYQYGYMTGADSERCNRRHSYHYDVITPAFARIEE